VPPNLIFVTKYNAHVSLGKRWPVFKS